MNTHWPRPGRIYNMKDEKGMKVVQKAMFGNGVFIGIRKEIGVLVPLFAPKK